MKTNLGARVLMLLHWLLSLAICAAFAAYVIVPEPFMRIFERFEASVGHLGARIIGVALLAIYAALAVCQLCLIFRRKDRADRGFITVDASETGRVRISIAAVEQLVRQSVDSIDGIADMQIDITNRDDAIGIVVNAAIVSGSHVPTITMNMQRSIRQFVEMNCGVAVRTVSISINSVSNAQDAPRRRHLLTKGEAARPAAAPVAPEKAPEAPVEAGTPKAGEAPAWKPEQPYVSEFARDLAAMKAAEAQATDGGEPAPEEQAK